MTTLAENQPRIYELGDINEFPVIASDIIFEGAAAGDNGSGYARPLQAGDPFLGFSTQKVDNASGSAGDKTVRVRETGKIQLPISGLAIDDRGKAVYASDDNTFTLTKGSNTLIGYVSRYVASGVGIVAFASQKGAEAELTDNSTGTASDTIAEITQAANAGSADIAPVENAIASLAAKINYLLRRQGL